VLQLVGVIAMALWNCISIDFSLQLLGVIATILDLVAFACNYCHGYSGLQ